MPINLTVCGGTDVGLVRKSNEDSFVIADLTGDDRLASGPMTRFEIGERGVLLAVSDGMGGHKAGEVASALVVQGLQRTMARAQDARSDDALFEEAVKRANREVWEASHVPGRENMGATLTAMFLQGPTAYIAEVGDSRAYLLRRGELVQVTRDQSYVQLLVEAGAMRPEEAAVAPSKNVILQAMGQRDDVQVALGRLELRQRDCFILCSDGLTNELSEAEIRQTVLGAPNMHVACAMLINLAKRHGGKDNITVILGGVSGDLPASTPDEAVSDTLQVLQEFRPTVAGVAGHAAAGSPTRH